MEGREERHGFAAAQFPDEGAHQLDPLRLVKLDVEGGFQLVDDAAVFAVGFLLGVQPSLRRSALRPGFGGGAAPG